MRYSPRPKEFYRVLSSRGVFYGPGEGNISAGEWNLYVLTELALDMEQAANFQSYWNVPSEVVSLYCYYACKANPELEEVAATARPTELVDWIKARNYKPMNIYQAFGEAWIELITRRAVEIEERMKHQEQGNVLYPHFGWGRGER